MLGVEHAVAPEMANPLLNSDSFDAEDSSDSERVPSLHVHSPEQESQETKEVFSDADSDEGISLRDIIDSCKKSIRPEASERAKSKKSGKSPKAKKLKKPKRDEVQKIHSETQRIVRDSSLRLPYHKPERKSIDDFFKKKPSSTHFLKPVPLKRAKNLNGGLVGQKHSNAPSTQHSNKTNQPQLNVNTSQASNQEAESSLQLPSSPVEDFPIVENWLKNIRSPKKDDCPNSELSIDIPDEQPSTDPTELNTDKLVVKEDDLTNSKEVEDSFKLMLSETQEDSLDYAKEDIDQTHVQQSGANKIKSDASASLPGTGATLQEDSLKKEILKETDHLGDKQIEDLANDSQPNNIVLVDDNFQMPVSNPGQTKVDHDVSSTPAASSMKMSQVKKHQLLLEASLEKFKSFTPKLQGSPEAVIDLDGSDEETTVVVDKGLRKLMDRFAIHTKKSASKKKRQVEISVVSKEVNKDGKENVRCDKVVTTLDGEEDEDPVLKIPGAKLLKLKDTLQATMRLKRQESRQKRQEMYRLDNEDLDGEEEEEGKDEEAELTDSDYDPEADNIKDDEMPEDADDVEEEMDEEDYDEPIRKKFEFGDEEADVDDDEYDTDGDDEEEEVTEISQKAKGNGDRAIASGEESSDEEDDMCRRKVTPTRVKKKKKLVLDEDEDDDDDEDKMVLKIPEDEPETKETKNTSKDSIVEPSETSRISATSSAKTSHVTKASSVSVGFTLDGSKTMDMFDSNTNLASTGDPDNKTVQSVSPTDGAESIGFSWSALKKRKEESKDDGSVESGNLKPDSASNSFDNSFEMFGSVIPAHQPGGGMKHADQFTPFSRQKSLLNLMPKSTSKLSELTLPVEDSQDLFREESPLPILAVTDSQHMRESQSFHFSFEEDETQSQFLDENGFLNVRPSIVKPKPMTKKLFGVASNATQNNMDELLGLCSGQFTEGTQAPRASSPRMVGGTGPFSEITKGLGESQGGMDELLQLCSGSFAKTQTQAKEDAVTNLTKDKQPNEEDVGSESSFHLISDNEGFRSDDDEELTKFKGLSDDEDDDTKKKMDEDDEKAGNKRRRIKMMTSSDEDEEMSEANKVKKFRFKNQKKSMMLKQNFVEAEAELSGSEYDSDENYDADDLADELEDDGADQEDVGDEDQLRDQVNKVHMKAVDDDDARQLRLYKELLLPDGDMHSDSKGRQRQFKWRNLNYEDSLTDMFKQPNSDEEIDDDKDEDTQWRMKRFEREQWLNENREKQPEQANEDIVPAEEENSQFVKFMKTAVQRKKKVKVPAIADNMTAESEKDKKLNLPKAIKTKGKFHGSFLHRKDEVAKIAANTIANPNGPRGHRNFVFQAISSDEKESRPPVKRSNSASSSSGSMAAPKAKRPRLERSQSTMSQNSIFNHF